MPANDFAALLERYERTTCDAQRALTKWDFGIASQTEYETHKRDADDARAALLAYGAGVEQEADAELKRRKFVQAYGTCVGSGIVSPNDAPTSEEMENPASTGVTVRCMVNPYVTRQFGYAYYADHLNADGTQNREAAERAAIDMAIAAVAAYELAENARREQAFHEAHVAYGQAQHFARKGIDALATRPTEARDDG